MKLRYYNNKLWISLLVTFVFSLASCDQQRKSHYSPQFSDSPPSKIIKYNFAVHPLHNPVRLFQVFGPLIKYLNQHIPDAQFQLNASRNYASFDKKLYAHQFDFALPNPYQTINAIDKGYKVFAKMGDDQNFRGIILVRKDSNIKNISDLKGKSISYPAPTALAATMMPQYLLHQKGLDIDKDLTNKYVGSQESSILSVYLGQTVAGSTWPPPWQALVKERPELARELTVKWKTDPLPNNGLVVLPSVPQDIVDQVQFLLIHLHDSEEGRVILETIQLSKFELATEKTYLPVRKFIVKFSNDVREVRQ